MPKTNIKGITKFKVLLWYLFKRKNGIVGHCQYCDSINITVSNKVQSHNFYSATYKCHGCGAEATAIEEWKH